MKRSVKHNIRLSQHVRPLRYEIMLKPDFENFTFYGEETIEVESTKLTKEIVLHAAELEIESAEFVYKTKEVWVGKISYNEETETVTLTFPKTITKGKGLLKLIFRGMLNDKMRGFYRSKYMIDGKEQYLATTQFEAVDARRAFPSFDEPAKKAIFDITFTIPSHLTAISNTIPTSVSEHESGYNVVSFAPTPKMSTYLVAFIIGEFEYIEGKSKKDVLVRVFTTPGKKAQGQFALDVAIRVLDFYEEYFGIAYPLSVLDLIAIPDFAYGAMENWGAVTYRESTLLIDEELSSSANRQWVALVIAHELAHQWFGNLVTMEWWTHLWLNEGFASYIEYLAIDHLFPQWDIWTQFVFLEQGTALRLDCLKHTHPIEVEVHHPSEINEIFDKVSYAKGASVIRMLVEYLGPKDFRAGLSYYLKKHNYANAKTSDLWAALGKVSGQNVGKIMANWTAKPGYPIVTAAVENGRLTLSQARFFSSSISRGESQDKTLWQIPITVLDGKRKRRYLLGKKTLSLVHHKTLQKINAGEAGFLRVDYPGTYLSRFAKVISAKNLTVVDRLGIIRDAFALCESGRLATPKALRLAQAYLKETDYVIWIEMSSSFRQIANLLTNEAFYPKYKGYCRALFFDIAKYVGWKKSINEKHTTTLLRSLVLYNLGNYGDKKTIQKAQALFKQVKDGNPLDPDLRSVVYNLVAENGGVSEYETLVALYKKEELQQEKERIGRALGLFRQKELLQKTLLFSLSSDVRSQAVNGIITSVWGNPRGQALAWEFVKAKWPLLKERYGGGHLLSRLIVSASDFKTKEEAHDIQRFFKKNPTPEASRTIAQVLEQITSNSSWLSRDSQDIHDFLTKSKAT